MREKYTDLLENALFSKSCDSALCNLLLFFLDSIFKCYDEETFEDSNAESEGESEHEDANQESDSGMQIYQPSIEENIQD